MDYKVIVTKDVEEDLDRFVQYLVMEKKSPQAANGRIVFPVIKA